uniref:Reverse transcriptase domain-containing protein n=1 Tax=Haemonchus contortus TaxID=6289 RepID=A0A7I4Z0T2_HAECO
MYGLFLCLLSVFYKLFTRVILSRISRILHEAGLKYRESTKCRYDLRSTFIDSKEAFDTVETEAIIESLANQDLPTQYIRMLRELYDNFTTRVPPFYKEVVINVKRGVRQGDTIPPKLFSAAPENIMRHSECEDLGVKVDGRYLHHLRFADDIVLEQHRALSRRNEC